MTHFDDLTSCQYFETLELAEAKNVGWLSSLYPFAQGQVSKNLLSKLRALAVTQPQNVCRGYHSCELCPIGRFEHLPQIDWRGELLTLGDAEIWVTSLDRIIYVSPNPIIHYIEEHDYSRPSAAR